jgi:CRP-like cAMP-binding protein
MCVKELDAGVGFGELALINNAPRSASIICHEDSHFATMDKNNFI